MIKKILYITVITFFGIFFMNQKVLASDACFSINKRSCEDYRPHGGVWDSSKQMCCFVEKCFSYTKSDGNKVYDWTTVYFLERNGIDGKLESHLKNETDCENYKEEVCADKVHTSEGKCLGQGSGYVWDQQANNGKGCCYTEEEYKKQQESNSGGNKFNASIDTTLGTCVDYLGEAGSEGTPAYYIDFVYNIVKVLVTVALVALSMLDLVKAIMNGGDELNKVYMKIVYRFLVVLVILLLPSLIESIGSLLGKSNILCGIG